MTKTNEKRRRKIASLQLDNRLYRDQNEALREEVLALTEVNDQLEAELKRMRAAMYGDDPMRQTIEGEL